MRITDKAGHRDTLDELVKLTRDRISDKVWLIWAVAQRFSVDIKIAASIAYVDCPYNKFLGSSTWVVHSVGRKSMPPTGFI